MGFYPSFFYLLFYYFLLPTISSAEMARDEECDYVLSNSISVILYYIFSYKLLVGLTTAGYDILIDRGRFRTTYYLK
jgi:hypothetical protein